jgi:membrane protease YdiL (CAAX protease family)
MNPITSFIKRYPQAVFWGIAYLISGGGYTLGRLYPNDLWILVLWGIFLGGALVTGIVDGKAGVKTYFGRLARFRAGIQWYAIALLTPFVLGSIAFMLNRLSGAEVVGGVLAFGAIAEIFIFSFFTIALGEEPGFRGFSLPRFMAGRSAWAASLILGVLHAIWHLPLVIGGDESVLTLINPLCAAVIFTWIFNHTNGSLFIAMLMHASSDAVGGIMSSLFSGPDRITADIWYGAAFIAMAILLRVFAGQELGRKPEAGMDTLTADQPALAR